MTQLYRGTRLGQSLVDTLDSMQEQNLLDAPMAQKVLDTFDQVFLAKLETLANQKSVANIKGPLHLYRFCSDVWTFIFKNASIKVDGEYLHVNLVKIVAMDSTKINTPIEQVDGEGRKPDGDENDEEQIQRFLHSDGEYYKDMKGAIKQVSHILK
eukprot:TRINITY_DN23198_c0_g1_i1.p1 TRINITY_DN23198_c0_g1~~TRINITY_DN23198_c0_g1_i1.p1  ORF type:complete len:155 (-),score=11.18 TRINITY_DN23198_c0_g1_i1:101-565(-)